MEEVGKFNVDRDTDSAIRKKNRVIAPPYSRETIIRRHVTPELLDYFSREEAEKIVKYCHFESPTCKTAYTGGGSVIGLEGLNEDEQSFLRNELEGRIIIELGSGKNKTNESFFRKIEVESFETVDPQVNTDGLSYLAKLPNESAIVCSFGLFDEGVLYPVDRDHKEVMRKYVNALSQQIYRVTPKGRITFHGLEFPHSFVDEGFKKETNLDLGRKSLIVFRKT